MLIAITAGTNMRVIFILLTFSVCLLHSGFACSDYEISQLKEQVSELNTKVDVLTNELRQFFQDFKQPSSQTSDGKEDEPTTETDDKTWSSPIPPFSLMEARREILGDTVKFTVQFTSNLNDYFFTTRWLSYTNEKVEWNELTPMEDDSREVFETSALFSLSEDFSAETRRTMAYLFLMTGDRKESLLLSLMYENMDAVSRNFSVRGLKVYPDGDFVYEEGQDFIFKVRMPSVSQSGAPSISHTLLNPSTGDVVNDIAGSSIEFVTRERLEDYTEVTLKVDTSNGSLSGFLTLNQEQSVYSAVVGMIITQRSIILRPEGQSGPLPDGYLSFVEQKYKYFGDNYNDNVTECVIGEICRFTCEVAGSDIYQVEIVSVGRHGNIEPLDSAKYDVEEFDMPYLSHKVVTFQENSVPETPDVLRCMARNADTRIFMDSTVIVISPVDLIEEESEIELLDLESDTDVTRFQIKCTGTGSPQPNISLTMNTLNSDFVSWSEEVIPTGEDKYTLVKEINVPTSEYIKSDWYLAVTCYAAQSNTGRIDDTVTMNFNENTPWGMTFNFTNPYYY